MGLNMKNDILSPSAPDLFQKVDFKSHAGLDLNWKIEMDALSAKEWIVLSDMISDYSQPFRQAIGIPRGGVKLGNLLNTHHATGISTDPILIVDDVLTTGMSMEEFKKNEQRSIESDFIGWVVFARTQPSSWIQALFQMPMKQYKI
jgi:hypothetical protein